MAVRLHADFDVQISEVLVAHRYALLPDMDMDSYRHGRNMQGLVCTISGVGEYVYEDGESVRLMPGEMALIPAAAAYRVHAAGNEPFEHYTANFLANAETLPEWARGTKLQMLRPKNPAMYLARFDELAETWRRMRPGYRMQTRAHLLALLADCLAESLSQNVDPAAYNRTLPAMRMIEKQYAEPLSLEQMAAACGMSVGSFRRAFSQVYDQSPVAYLLSLRVEKAKGLLLLGLSLEDVAQKTGFSDVSYFIRYFRKATGVTPGKFRQMY